MSWKIHQEPKKKSNLKKILLKTTKFHELMAKTFYDAKVQKDGDVTLPTSEEDSK